MREGGSYMVEKGQAKKKVAGTDRHKDGDRARPAPAVAGAGSGEAAGDRRSAAGDTANDRQAAAKKAKE